VLRYAISNHDGTAYAEVGSATVDDNGVDFELDLTAMTWPTGTGEMPEGCTFNPFTTTPTTTTSLKR
jgi:hypothetical protein